MGTSVELEPRRSRVAVGRVRVIVRREPSGSVTISTNDGVVEAEMETVRVGTVAVTVREILSKNTSVKFGVKGEAKNTLTSKLAM